MAKRALLRRAAIWSLFLVGSESDVTGLPSFTAIWCFGSQKACLISCSLGKQRYRFEAWNWFRVRSVSNVRQYGLLSTGRSNPLQPSRFGGVPFWSLGCWRQDASFIAMVFWLCIRVPFWSLEAAFRARSQSNVGHYRLQAASRFYLSLAWCFGVRTATELISCLFNQQHELGIVGCRLRARSVLHSQGMQFWDSKGGRFEAWRLPFGASFVLAQTATRRITGCRRSLPGHAVWGWRAKSFWSLEVATWS